MDSFDCRIIRTFELFSWLSDTENIDFVLIDFVLIDLVPIDSVSSDSVRRCPVVPYTPAARASKSSAFCCRTTSANLKLSHFFLSSSNCSAKPDGFDRLSCIGSIEGMNHADRFIMALPTIDWIVRLISPGRRRLE